MINKQLADYILDYHIYDIEFLFENSTSHPDNCSELKDMLDKYKTMKTVELQFNIDLMDNIISLFNLDFLVSQNFEINKDIKNYLESTNILNEYFQGQLVRFDTNLKQLRELEIKVQDKTTKGFEEFQYTFLKEIVSFETEIRNKLMNNEKIEIIL